MPLGQQGIHFGRKFYFILKICNVEKILKSKNFKNVSKIFQIPTQSAYIYACHKYLSFHVNKCIYWHNYRRDTNKHLMISLDSVIVKRFGSLG